LAYAPQALRNCGRFYLKEKTIAKIARFAMGQVGFNLEFKFPHENLAKSFAPLVLVLVGKVNFGKAGETWNSSPRPVDINLKKVALPREPNWGLAGFKNT
jgi:hypothetical protein